MPLSRSEVIDGALRLLDKQGLDSLTMRRLADTLGVQAGAIYWHFKGKQDLYDAMIDSMFGGLLVPEVKGRWDERLTALAQRMAAALARRRDGARLATLALRPGQNTLAVSEALLRTVYDAGLPAHASLWAAAVVGYYVLGYVTDVQATEAAKARGLESMLRAFEKELDPARFPLLFEASSGGIEQMVSRREFEARFEFGLRVILNGLKRTRAPRPRRTTRRLPRRGSKQTESR